MSRWEVVEAFLILFGVAAGVAAVAALFLGEPTYSIAFGVLSLLAVEMTS